jgi:hypothetical protein
MPKRSQTIINKNHNKYAEKVNHSTCANKDCTADMSTQYENDEDGFCENCNKRFCANCLDECAECLSEYCKQCFGEDIEIKNRGYNVTEFCRGCSKLRAANYNKKIKKYLFESDFSKKVANKYRISRDIMKSVLSDVIDALDVLMDLE